MALSTPLGHTKLTPNALRVLEARYLTRDSHGKVVETPDELFFRVAKAVAQAESVLGNPSGEPYWQEKFHQILSSLDFLPNSPALMNAGLPLGQMSACFVLPVEDTMSGIFEALKQAALVQQTGGGTGFSFSHLRPKGDLVKSTGGEASGPMSFMKIFDSATEHIKQGGKRRGANMGVLRVDHPDILEFVTAKLDETSLQNFNISVGVTDTFFEAARRGENYDLIHPRTHKTVGQLSAEKVLNVIIESCWKSGDPGLLFLDAINRGNPTPSLGAFEATNPCGEIPLLPNESCNLGSINLAHHLRQRESGLEVDWERLRTTVHTAMRFLDNLIEINRYPTPEIAEMSRANRKVGLGVMGFAELLIRLGIPYDSDQAPKIGERIMGMINEEARKASQQLGKERGVFQNYEQSVYASDNLKLRNATCTAIAPTGTISIIANTTPGIEPLFALAYRRSHTLGGEPLHEMAPTLLDHCQRQGLTTEDLASAIFKKGRLKDVPNVPKETKDLFVTALEIPPEGHLHIQAAFQRHVDNSVSKTINLSEDATREDVGHAFWRAWELNLKGITIYRYGSKASQVLEVGKGMEPGYTGPIPACHHRKC